MKKLTNSFLIFATIGLLLFEVHLLTRAQEGAAPEVAPIADSGTTPENFALDATSKCVLAMQNFMAKKQVEFGEFMNVHFRSSNPTSDLIPGAVERFRQYREEVRQQMEDYLPQMKADATAALLERPKCQEAVDQEFMLMKSLLRDHILANAYAKKSTRLLDKYKQINDKLGKLNFTIAQMYGYFAALSDKLPCYATKCNKS
ncbi:MAG: hypothetical protein AAB588_04665 [Patescibacteria group bacterium]